jgi:high-affinity iron transporter
MNSMLLNSVILVLQETLEAALLVSVLLAISYRKWQSVTWLPLGLLAGLVLAFVYASQMDVISEWFDYVGQEVVNALLQTAIAVPAMFCAWALVSSGQAGSAERQVRLFSVSAGIAVALAITREGSEVLMYLGGFLQVADYFQPVMIGSLIGFGIGVSIGLLLFYGLLALSRAWARRSAVFLLSLFSGNMLSQAALQLTQADWIPAAKALWNTSGWISETSIPGQLMYALIGYEATPSPVQVLAYATGVVLVYVAAWLASSVSAQAGKLA